MILHQSGNSAVDELYNCYFYRNARWQMHYHRAYELVWVTEGELSATVEERTYLLHAGDGLLLFPYQLHAYETAAHSSSYITVFSGSYVGKFASLSSGRVPTDARFSLSERLCGVLRAYMTENGTREGEGDCVLLPTPSPFAAKALLYAVCDEFLRTATLCPRKEGSALVHRILSYVEAHYAEDITLTGMAEALSYEYHYVSRVIRETLHMHFRTLVNQYRCEQEARLMDETALPLSQIATRCGFGSLRTFNRVFRRETDRTPSALRRGDGG